MCDGRDILGIKPPLGQFLAEKSYIERFMVRVSRVSKDQRKRRKMLCG